MGVIKSFTAPGITPYGLAFDGKYLWHTDDSTDLIYQLDFKGNVIKSIASPGPGPRGVSFDGKYLWYIDWDENKIYQLDRRG